MSQCLCPSCKYFDFDEEAQKICWARNEWEEYLYGEDKIITDYPIPECLHYQKVGFLI